MNPLTPHLAGWGRTLPLLKIWWPVLFGLLVLYVPTYWMLAHGLWNTEEQAHGPIVLVVAFYLIWQKRDIFLIDASDHPSSTTVVFGSVMLAFGLLAYALGRSQDILLFEVGSQNDRNLGDRKSVV